MRFTKRTSKRAEAARVTMQDGLETLAEFWIPTPVDPTPEWTRAALLRLAHLRAKAAAVARLARDLRDD